MKPIRYLITLDMLTELSSRSNFRYGKEIAKDGKITVVESNAFRTEARVEYKNKEARTAELSSTPKGLRWKCTCSSRKNLFCEHCIALGFYILDSSK
jgi:hypothetical protein